MQNQVQTLKGFRDLLPADKRKRDYVAAKIKTVFERFGFEPLETPTLEYASLLLGKYGEEADKLVYTFEDRGERQIGLRYDQTVPTARVLAQYQNDLPRYFRRYQIQNVFRADKPQKGRFREFTQCDCDIFGSTASLADAEILAVYYAVYKDLGITSIQIQINDRQTLLSTLSPFATDQVSVFSLVQSIDKLDKQTADEVATELTAKGLSLEASKQVLSEIEKADMSANLSEIVDNAIKLGVAREALVFNPKLARGLDYYTGLIFEGRIPEYAVGSVGGGGRYDKLVGELSGLEMPAVGFGIGFDRTVEAADELGLIPAENMGTQVLVTVFDNAYLSDSLTTANQLRTAGVKVELYPAVDKLAKQFKLADQKNIPWVVIIGEAEAADNKVTLKNMKTGEQQLMSMDEVVGLVLG
ncbi:MAG TPA: histidine--tRNA ligase [Vitreimonas sp.]|nr:histidine--tRNA ligase [Vitreimonas sp.]